jgi:hypothetical protein
MQVSKQTAESTNIMLVPLRGCSKREQSALILRVFTMCVSTTHFPSPGPPTLIADVLSASRVAFPIHTLLYLTKNPGVSSSRVLWSFYNVMILSIIPSFSGPRC